MIRYYLGEIHYCAIHHPELVDQLSPAGFDLRHHLEEGPTSASHFLHRPESVRCWASAASNSASDVPNTFAVQAWHVLCRSADPPGGFAGAPQSAAVSGGAIGIQSVPLQRELSRWC